jgi:hypothetical protein
LFEIVVAFNQSVNMVLGMNSIKYTADQIARMEHLKPKNIIRAFNPAIGQQELMERAALMQDVNCTSAKITALKARWSK